MTNNSDNADENVSKDLQEAHNIQRRFPSAWGMHNQDRYNLCAYCGSILPEETSTPSEQLIQNEVGNNSDNADENVSEDLQEGDNMQPPFPSIWGMHNQDRYKLCPYCGSTIYTA
jgi:hypothetical protein